MTYTEERATSSEVRFPGFCGLSPSWQVQWLLPGLPNTATNSSAPRCCPRQRSLSRHDDGPIRTVWAIVVDAKAVTRRESVEQPTEFYLFINRGAARKLGTRYTARFPRPSRW